MGRRNLHAGTDGTRSARLIWAIAVNLILTIAQVAGGIYSGSLALVSDALHNLNDAASLGIALLAQRIGRLPADRHRTFGYRRAELIGALINLTALGIVGIYLIYVAIRRFFDQPEILGWVVIAVAVVALAVDIVTAVLTYSMSRDSLNIKAAFVHNLSDALASLGVIVAGTLILLFGWYWADLAATILISAYILYQAGVLMRSTIRMLMYSVPEDICLEDVVDAMRSVENVAGIHHIHVWELDEEHRALEAHVVLEHHGLGYMEPAKNTIKTILKEQFRITHSTLEFETSRAENHDADLIAGH